MKLKLRSRRCERRDRREGGERGECVTHEAHQRVVKRDERVGCRVSFVGNRGSENKPLSEHTLSSPLFSVFRVHSMCRKFNARSNTNERNLAHPCNKLRPTPHTASRTTVLSSLPRGTYLYILPLG